MDANNPASPASATVERIDDLYTLTLVDGLVTSAGKHQVHYRVVKLRETNTNDERRAVQLSERVVMVGGKPTLLSSSAEYQLALTMLHVDELQADGATKLAGAALDLDLFGRLSTHDVGLIEQRVFLLTLAAQVRYGLITQEQFDQIVTGKGPTQTAAAAPQPVGQAAGAGAAAPESEPGPALLADFTGGAAGGAPAGNGV